MLLFVYGTLMTGLPNHRCLADAHSLGRAATGLGFKLVDYGYFPAMTAAPGQRVVGELFRINHRDLARCDRLEGHPDFYTRIQLPGVWIGTERSAPCWTYIIPAERLDVHAAPVPNNNWLNKETRHAHRNQ